MSETSQHTLTPMASVTHELRAPLHAIIGLAELLTGRDLDPRSMELASAIHREGTALQLIVDDLLDLSKIAAGEMELVVTALAPRGLADEVMSMFRPAAEAKGLKLAMHADEDVPIAVRADRYRLRQVIVNLVSNAIKYTTTGGVTLTVSTLAPGVLRFLVSDSGPGIPDEALADLFVPFQQARASDRRQGTGLGLSICHRLVELLDGHLFVCPSAVGTTFSVSLPFEPARRGADLVAAATPTASAGRVLVVEDTEVNRLVALSQLERLGHVGVAVEDGVEALALLETERFDAILMDWHMPRVDGLETTRRYLRWAAEAGIEATPIIMMTASASHESRIVCREAGTSDFLPKPVSLDALDTCLRRWLEPPELVASGMADDPAAALSPEVVVDAAVLLALVDDLGGREPVAMVIDTFVGDAPARVATMGDGADAPSAQRAAHTLKSTAALVGAAALADQAAAIEAIYGAGEAPTGEQLDAIAAQLDAVMVELQTIRATLAEPRSPEHT